jgi:hypothetical protein
MFQMRVKPGLKAFPVRCSDDRFRDVTLEWSEPLEDDLMSEFIGRNPSIEVRAADESAAVESEAEESGASVEVSAKRGKRSAKGGE